MIDPDTVLYTAAASLEEVARGFLGGMDAKVMFGDAAWQSIAPVLVSHVEEELLETDEPKITRKPVKNSCTEFTCGQIARLIERMAKGEA